MHVNVKCSLFYLVEKHDKKKSNISTTPFISSFYQNKKFEFLKTKTIAPTLTTTTKILQ